MGWASEQKQVSDTSYLSTYRLQYIFSVSQKQRKSLSEKLEVQSKAWDNVLPGFAGESMRDWEPQWDWLSKQVEYHENMAPTMKISASFPPIKSEILTVWSTLMR